MALDPNHKTHRHRGNPPVNQFVTSSDTVSLILVIYDFNMWTDGWGSGGEGVQDPDPEREKVKGKKTKNFLKESEKN